MDCKHIIENGYGKLAEYLPDADKRYLEGMKRAQDELENFKLNIEDLFSDEESETLRKIKIEQATAVIEEAAAYLESEHDMTLISFVDSNHYSIVEDGTVVDDDNPGNE